MNRLFAGLLITNKLREQLNQVNDSARTYFLSNDPNYLQIIRDDNGREYLGKWVDHPLPLQAVENISQHLSSIMKLILPHNRFTADHFKIFIIDSASVTR